MGSSVDSYLHKKFKKQLSIEPKPQNHDKENKANSRVVESSEEKMTFENGHATAAECANQLKRDNNESVPNKSTNQNSSYFTVNSSYNSKSSISNDKCITNLQSNPCISSDISSGKVALDGFRRVSFDNQFNSVPSTVRSSINDNLNSKTKYVNKPDDISVDNFQSKEEVAVNKPEEVQPPPDRNSSGKYVCNYCNLVCSKPSVLQKHIRAHTNERPYPCVSCGFSFKTRSNLYKHCRSRTHANRVMGNKAQEITNEAESTKVQNISKNHEEPPLNHQDSKSKPYKPRFHTAKLFDSVSKENIEEDKQDNVSYHNPDAKDFITHHINEIINKNTSIVSSNDVNLLKKRLVIESSNNNDYSGDSSQIPDEPLNLSNKNRKRSMSEVVAEPQVQKSLIKELLLKNVYSNINMQCQYCKMIFQTVTELELHEFRSCKGKPSGAKYTRSSSVNVASILTQNKNAFDNIPYLQNTAFPLNSPGPFLGKTRLVESDKSKSFSFDDGLRSNLSISNDLMSNFSLSPFEKKMPVKLFGGEVKIAQSTGETKKFKIDSKTQEKFETSKSFDDYSDKLSENRVIKFSLQSGGTVLTNKSKVEPRPQDVMRNYDIMSPSVDRGNLSMPHFNFERHGDVVNDHREDVLRPVSDESISLSPNVKTSNIYPTIMDFSQKAVKMLTPNLKQPNIIVTASPTKFMYEDTKPVIYEMDWDPETRKPVIEKTPSVIRKVVPVPRPSPNLPSSPVNLLVDGKLVRHVPGMPGPVVAEEPIDMAYNGSKILVTSPRPPKPSPLSMPTVRLSPEPMDTSEPPSPQRFSKPYKTESLEIKTDFLPKGGERRSPSIKITEFRSPIKSSELKSPLGIIISESKKFARPNSLALKPTTASLKQHHGLTPTMFNQILISPDTPRVNKKYVHHFLNGNCFSYLDLKSSTKPVYCTLNKTQPFYVPHFKKLSMYSEWRQQDTKTDKLFVSAYDSRQKPQRYTQAGRNQELLYIDSSYKFMVSELPSNNVEMSNNVEKEEQSKPNQILGGYESNEDYTYIRGRGRGRYVCEQCGIRCKKPSMLKKHIRTHSIDRPYTCNHCNFSFKTKGNLTKHMKSKVHTKNYSASSSSSSSTQQSGTQSSESDTDDSGMDSSDESTRQQEHEAAYGLLSLSQKTTQNITSQPDALVNSNSLSNHCYSPVSSMAVTENVMSTDEITYLSKFNIAKNKTLEERSPLIITVTNVNHEISQHSEESFSDPPPPQHNNHDKNSMAKSVASEYLKIATQFEVNQDGVIDATTIGPISKDMNDLIVKPEGNKTCGICHKSFSKPSQLRLHMNIHYLERPFRCDSCSVSFRSKGHLLKHERSASHHNKLSATSVQASAEPRPFKCSDCNIAFRIHGHLAKHLRSKMHIMKLECLAKIPFGLYAELERSNSLLTEINTCDGDQCLESLKTLAKKVFSNDPSKLNQMEATDVMDADN